MGRVLVLILLLWLLPVATAGTPEDPEISDPADAAAGQLDIRAVWLVPQDAHHVAVHVLLETLAAGDSGTIDVLWQDGPPLRLDAPSTLRGVRFTLSLGGVEARELRESGGALDTGPSAGNVSRSDGSPGRLVATVTGGGGGAMLHDFSVVSRVASPGIFPSVDEAAGEAELVLPKPFLDGTSPWPHVQGRSFSSDTAAIASIDILEVHVQRNDTGVDIDVEVAALSPEAIAACGVWGMYHSYDGADHGFARIDTTGGYWEEDLWAMRIDGRGVPFEMRVTYGEPGLVQIHAPHAGDAGLVNQLDYVAMDCGEENDHASAYQRPSFPLGGGDMGALGWVMGAPFILAGVAILVFYFRVR